MLFLLFQLGEDRYALDAARSPKSCRWSRSRAIPQAPAGVAGVFNYRGAPVPAIDLSQLTLGRPARAPLEHAHRPRALPRRPTAKRACWA